jgi:enoyl-CoA hydratase
MYQTISVTLENAICLITIQRPEKLNALNKQVFTDLNTVLDDIYQNKNIRSAIITGAGPKAFVAGADISEFAELSKEDSMALAKAGQDTFFRIERSPIACVNGFALGGGCELAMSCHFRIASENARFGQPEVNLGLIPGYGGTQRLVQLIGKGRAIEFLISGNMIDAHTALQYGLVNQVVSQEELLIKAKSILELIHTKAPIAVAKCIESANAVYDEKLDGYAVEVAGFGFCFDTKDRIEGTTSFLQKRKADFTGS